MTPLDAMKQALEFVEMASEEYPTLGPSIATNLRTAIAELEGAKPVAWHCKTHERSLVVMYEGQTFGDVTPLFTHPSPNANKCKSGEIPHTVEHTAYENVEPVAYAVINGDRVVQLSVTQDPFYPHSTPLFAHPMQSRGDIIEECAVVCEEVHSRYPTDIFPEGQSVNAQSAKMARITANNCALEIRALKGK